MEVRRNVSLEIDTSNGPKGDFKKPFLDIHE
jgi:hypothetical protein